MNWGEFSAGPLSWSVTGALILGAEAAGLELFHPGEEVALGESYQQPPSTHREVIKKMEPGSSPWCMVGG